MRRLVLLVVLLLASSPVFADNLEVTFSIQNAPGTIGDFSWTIVTGGFNQSLDTAKWLAISNPTNGGGCAIKEISLLAEGNGTDHAYGLTTFFSPLCQGLYDSTTAGVDFSFLSGGKDFGTVNWSGTNPDNTISHDSLTLEPTTLPVTSPEPGSLGLAMTGFALWGLLAYRRRMMVVPSHPGLRNAD
jgi:hypothetical protein